MGLIRFRPTEQERLEIDRLSQAGGVVGMMPAQGWFCVSHYAEAAGLKDLSMGEALRNMRMNSAEKAMRRGVGHLGSLIAKLMRRANA
jgi:hypothetical protein